MCITTERQRKEVESSKEELKAKTVSSRDTRNYFEEIIFEKQIALLKTLYDKE